MNTNDSHPLSENLDMRIGLYGNVDHTKPSSPFGKSRGSEQNHSLRCWQSKELMGRHERPGQHVSMFFYGWRTKKSLMIAMMSLVSVRIFPLQSHATVASRLCSFVQEASILLCHCSSSSLNRQPLLQHSTVRCIFRKARMKNRHDRGPWHRTRHL